MQTGRLNVNMRNVYEVRKKFFSRAFHPKMGNEKGGGVKEREKAKRKSDYETTNEIRRGGGGIQNKLLKSSI